MPDLRRTMSTFAEFALCARLRLPIEKASNIEVFYSDDNGDGQPKLQGLAVTIHLGGGDASTNG